MAWTLSTCISETVSSMFTSSSLGSCAMVAVVGWRAQSAELRRWWRRGRVRVKTAAVAEQTWAGANTLRERRPARECLNSGDGPHGDSMQRRAHSTQASCEAPHPLPPQIHDEGWSVHRYFIHAYNSWKCVQYNATPSFLQSKCSGARRNCVRIITCIYLPMQPGSQPRPILANLQIQPSHSLQS